MHLHDTDDEAALREVLSSLDCPTPTRHDLRERARDFAARHFPGGEEPALLEDGAELGNYRIERVLGWGGQAVVYLASHRHAAERQVALKIPHPDCAERLIREGRTLANLSHPNLVRMLDVDPTGEPPFLALEYCPGGSLADRIAADGALSEEETLRIARQLLTGLAYAHEQGIVHRDLKPENILFDAKDTPRIADFGLGKLAADQLSYQLSMASHTGLVGTPLYLAPEQARPGAPTDKRSDLYAFGMLLYAMLTGESPRALRPVEQVRPELSKDWTALVFELTAEDPDKRPGSVEEVIARLDQGGQVAAEEKRAAKKKAEEQKGWTWVLVLSMIGAFGFMAARWIERNAPWGADEQHIVLDEALQYRLEDDDFSGDLRSTGRGPILELGYVWSDAEERLEACGLFEDDKIVDLPPQIATNLQARDHIYGLFMSQQPFSLRVLRGDRLLTIHYTHEGQDPGHSHDDHRHPALPPTPPLPPEAP